MLALNHKLLDIKDFPRFRFPWKGTLRTPLQILACRFSVLDTIGLGLALSWRIAAVCPWHECFPKKCTSRGSNSDNISDWVRPWLRASSPVDYYSWMPRSVSLHPERGYSEFCLLQGLEPSPDCEQKKKKKKTNRMWHTPKLLANIIISPKIPGL